MAATLLYGDNWIDKVVTKVQLSQRVWITIFSRGSWRLETNKEKKYHYQYTFGLSCLRSFELKSFRVPTLSQEHDRLVLISYLIFTRNRKYKILDIFYFGQIKILRQFLWELHWCYIENREKQELECWRNFDFEKFLLLKKNVLLFC